MQYIYDFNLEKIVNIDNYFNFLEIYLKENQILKKDFFNRTSICPNSYRFFLRNKEKNKIFYYNIIAKEFNLFLPTEQELKDLSKSYSKIVEDILYKRSENLEEDNKIIEEVRKRNNPNNNPKMQSIEAVLFEIIYVILNISFGKGIISENYQLLEYTIPTLSNYDFLIREEYNALFLVCKIQLLAMKQQDFESELMKCMEYIKYYSFLQPLFYKIFSDSYFLKKDYVNSIIFGMKAYDFFINTYNFQRAISTKINLSYSYILMGSYINAYQSLNELYLSFHALDEKQKSSILRVLIETMIMLKKHDEIYEIFNLHKKIIYQNELLIEYMYVLYRLNKKKEFEVLYEEFIDKWENNSLHALYYDIVQLLYKKYIIHKNLKESTENIKGIISKLHNPTFAKICTYIFNVDEEETDDESAE